jgi:hypothetical protein
MACNWRDQVRIWRYGMASGWEDSKAHAQTADWVPQPYAAKADIGGKCECTSTLMHGRLL